MSETGETTDAFHRGRYHLLQPQRGHRAGMDAMMLAAALPSGFSGRVADLGAGAGAAGLGVLSRCAAATCLLVERDSGMAGYARRTLALPQNAALAPRAAVLEADVTLAGRARVAAGLADDGFDAAIMNPPFNAPHDRRTPDILKQDAHVMHDGLFEAWMRTAAAIVRPRGLLALIARPQSLTEVLDAAQGRFGGAEVIFIHPRHDAPAIRFVLRAVRASRAGLTIRPPLFLHDAGSDLFNAHADAINNGRAGLFDD
ncbi:MAG: methyltransferase [Notoacmeibacter sp.]|nr:methyltransferase [Notoacmeibacter sp.]MCC0032052.1 methyltransferase [Brucellaceae bacterium]